MLISSNCFVKPINAGKKATLKNISFTAKTGDFIVITGKSGCGKTTLLKLFNGISSESFSGRIEGLAYISELVD